jgi:hypothetical protein
MTQTAHRECMRLEIDLTRSIIGTKDLLVPASKVFGFLLLKDLISSDERETHTKFPGSDVPEIPAVRFPRIIHPRDACFRIMLHRFAVS